MTTARLPGNRRNKFFAKPTRIDGVFFPSQKEARRWGQLKLLEKAGVVRDLAPHPSFALTVLAPNGEIVTVGKMTLDSAYELKVNGGWQQTYEDCKGGSSTKTEAYRLRKKIVEALYGITVSEV